MRPRRGASAEGSVEVDRAVEGLRTARRAATGGLRALTLRVGPGEVAALVGANGSGKTTALRIVATLVEPSAGRAFVCGLDTSREPGAVRRRIGLSLGSGRSFYWRLTARQNLTFFARLAHMGGRGMREAHLRARPGAGA